MSRLARRLAAAALALAVPAVASAAGTIHVSGPDGPMPAIKEAAPAFGTPHGVTVDVAAGPKPIWIGYAS